MCALGIDKLRQHPAEILLLGRHAKQNTLGAHVAVETLDIGDSEAQLDLSCWVLRRLCAHAAMCAFGIDELRQHPPEILPLCGMLNRTPLALMSR